MANIELTDLKKTFGKGDNTVHAVDGINLTIGDGEFVSMVGRSGSGKTTTLDCLGLLMKPTSGRIVIDGTDTSTLSDGKRADFRSHKIGFIFQGFNLLPSLNAIDNVMRPAQLSGGEQQRVAIARALINQPTLVLGDEPTGEVDTETSQKLIALMRRLNRETGVTFILVTHDLDLASRTDRLVRLKDGRVISDERQTARTDEPADDIADMVPAAEAKDGKGEPVAVA